MASLSEQRLISNTLRVKFSISSDIFCAQSKYAATTKKIDFSFMLSLSHPFVLEKHPNIDASDKVNQQNKIPMISL